MESETNKRKEVEEDDGEADLFREFESETLQKKKQKKAMPKKGVKAMIPTEEAEKVINSQYLNLRLQPKRETTGTNKQCKIQLELNECNST